MAGLGQIGQDEEIFKRMMNPDDIIFQKNAPINTEQVFMWAAKHLGAGAEQELQFVQIRPNEFVGMKMAGPFNVDLNISDQHLPDIHYVPDAPERHGLFNTQPGIPFSVNLDLPSNIIEGAPFPLYLSVTSQSLEWTRNPPPVQLLSLKIKLRMITIARASTYRESNDHLELVFDAKHLGVMLGPQPLDVGQLYNFTLSGNGVVPSFNSRLLERIYNLPTELMIEVGGKTFKADFLTYNTINVVSRLAATGQIPASVPHGRGKSPSIPANIPPGRAKAPKQEVDWLDVVCPEPDTSSTSNTVAKKIRLKWSYVGRLIQQGNGPLQPESVMEAALTLSRLLTESNIQHEFPGGSVVRLLPYKPPRGSNLNDKNYDQRQDDREILQPFFHERFSYDPVEWSRDVLGVHVTYIDQLHGENIRIEFAGKYCFSKLGLQS
jgi:hypothetical protein